MASMRTELLPFKCPTCAHCAHLAKRLIHRRPAGPPAPYVCARCGHHSVPGNLFWIGLASLLFFAVGALCLSPLSHLLSLDRESMFFLDIISSIVFFQLFARCVIAWRPVAHEATSTETSA
jgi:hypothetical protein